MQFSAALLALFAVALGTGCASADDEGVRLRAVVELFTSQACSACPPADALLRKLSQDPSLIVLSLPVDYWDYLGWKDTLGSPAHTARQRAYAMSRGDRKVYTPQMVVNGIAQTVGSDEPSVGRAVEETRRSPEVLDLGVTIRRVGDRLEIHAHSASGRAVLGEVWLLATARERQVHVDRGENGGSTFTYANVVRKMTRIGPWNGSLCNYGVPTAEALGADGEGLVVLVQAGSGGMPGAILGAARLRP